MEKQTSPQKNGIKLSQLDEVSLLKQIGVKEPQLGGVTEPQLGGVKVPQLDGVKEPQLGGVTESQLGGVKVPQLDGVKESQLGGVKKSQLGGVKESQLGGVKESQQRINCPICQKSVVLGRVSQFRNGKYSIVITPVNSGMQRLSITMNGQHVYRIAPTT